MDDDFNTAAAIGHLYEAFVLANKLLDEPKAARQGRPPADAGPAAQRPAPPAARRWASSSARPAAFLVATARRLCARRGIDPAAVEARIAERAAARAAKDFARADEIRQALQETRRRAHGHAGRHHLARGLSRAKARNQAALEAAQRVPVPRRPRSRAGPLPARARR